MKPSTYRPRLFIGSSSEGLKVARAAKDLLSENTLPTLWEEDIFLPGTITLEVLEEQLAKHAFALLVATPDDLLLKRQEVVTTLRDIAEIRRFQRQLVDMLQGMTYIYLKS